MGDFVDGYGALPEGKTDLATVPDGDENKYVSAAEWNLVMAAMLELRGYSLRSGNADSGGAQALNVPGNYDLHLGGNNPDSRDAPISKLIFENVGLPNNPRFCIGNPYVAGVGLNAGGIWYTDDTLSSWKIILSFEQSGTFAAVLDSVRRSAVEAFLNNGDHKPFMRIEASSQALQIGAGGFLVEAGGATRSGGVLTLTTATINGEQQVHKMGVGQQLFKQAAPGYAGNVSDFGDPGEAWGPGGSSMFVASVLDEHTITVTDARGSATNSEPLTFSTEPADDVQFGRDAYGVAAIRVKDATRMQVTEFGIELPVSSAILSQGGSVNLGSNGVSSVGIDGGGLHVFEGKEFFNEGTYRSTGWYNGGGQVQTSQEVFIVGTGSGNKTTTLRDISGTDWVVLRVFNDGQGQTNTLTVLAGSDDTIHGVGSLTLPADASATFVSCGNNWQVQYHPPPP